HIFRSVSRENHEVIDRNLRKVFDDWVRNDSKQPKSADQSTSTSCLYPDRYSVFLAVLVHGYMGKFSPHLLVCCFKSALRLRPDGANPNWIDQLITKCIEADGNPLKVRKIRTALINSLFKNPAASLGDLAALSGCKSILGFPVVELNKFISSWIKRYYKEQNYTPRYNKENLPTDEGSDSKMSLAVNNPINEAYILQKTSLRLYDSELIYMHYNDFIQILGIDGNFANALIKLMAGDEAIKARLQESCSDGKIVLGVTLPDELSKPKSGSLPRSSLNQDVPKKQKCF
ncbi:MAG: hypothetical protein ACK5Y6_04170, partial [Pseudomonadota bacterium]